MPLRMHSIESHASNALKSPRLARHTTFSSVKRSIPLGPISAGSKLEPIKFTENESWYELALPLAGIDPDKLFVFATPSALLIETRTKSTVDHMCGCRTVTEHAKQMISREFCLPSEIEYGGTTIEIQGETLLIRALKSRESHRVAWSKFINFNTRGSLGCIFQPIGETASADASAGRQK